MNDWNFSYQPKPDLPINKREGSMSKTLLSVLLFAVLFYFFISDSILMIGLIVTVLFIHELGHYIMMKRYKYENIAMIFIPFLGAMVQGKKSNSYSQKERANVILAGPVPGIVIGVALFFLGLQFQQIYLVYAGVLFASVNVLNLIPIDPLDGGQLMYLLFFDRKDALRLYFLLLSSLTIIVLGLYFGNYLVMGFGFLLGVRVRAFQKILSIHKELKFRNVDYVKTYDQLSDQEFHTIKRVILEHSALAKKMVDSDVAQSQEFEDVMASEVNSVLEVPVIEDMSFNKKIFYSLTWLGSIALVIWVFYSNYPKLLELLTFIKNESAV